MRQIGVSRIFLVGQQHFPCFGGEEFQGGELSAVAWAALLSRVNNRRLQDRLALFVWVLSQAGDIALSTACVTNALCPPLLWRFGNTNSVRLTQLVVLPQKR